MIPTTRRPTLLGVPEGRLDDLRGASVVVIGAPEATPYVRGLPSHSADAPGAIRLASERLVGQLRQHDFDLGDALFPHREDWRGVIDCGDLVVSAREPAAANAAIRDSVAAIVAAGAVPIVLGGDDSVPVPALEGFAAAGPLSVVQLDAHVDWGDRIMGERRGYGSPMRRAAEMPHVTAMAQIGIRGLGSGERWQHDDARAWGSRIVTAAQVHRDGAAAALAGLPDQPAVVAIDCDALDPAVFPAVAMPTPGGLSYQDAVAVLQATAARGRIAGLVLAEFVPERDPVLQPSGLVAARLAAVAIGLALKGRG